MRKSIILALAATALTLTSCDDFLERNPRDTFVEGKAFWDNDNAVKSYTNRFYTNFVGYGTGQGWFYFKSLSDDQAAATRRLDLQDHTQHVKQLQRLVYRGAPCQLCNPKHVWFKPQRGQQEKLYGSCTPLSRMELLYAGSPVR